MKLYYPIMEEGRSQWQTEMKFLSQFDHQNLVKVLAYCDKAKDRVLVYEYLENKSFDFHSTSKSGFNFRISMIFFSFFFFLVSYIETHFNHCVFIKFEVVYFRLLSTLIVEIKD